MVLYIGEQNDQQFVGEIARNITEEIRMITGISSIIEATKVIEANNNASYVLINVMCMRDSQEIVVKQLKYIQSSIAKNLIVIARGLSTSDAFVQSLYFAGIKNVILSSWMPTVTSQCIKYITGAYGETSLLEDEAYQLVNGSKESMPTQTERLDLKEVFQNDPDILQQLQEEAVSSYNNSISQETGKLSEEELQIFDPDMLKQVKEYEQEQQQESGTNQSTILYEQQEKEQMAVQPTYTENSNQGNTPPLYWNQNQINQVYPEQSLQNGINSSNASPNLYIEPQNMGAPVNQVAQNPIKNQNKKVKREKKHIALTIGLCAILLLSISIPVAYTLRQGTEETKGAKEVLAIATIQPSTMSPVENTKQPTETPSIEETTNPTKEASQEVEPTEDVVTITLTPIQVEATQSSEPTKAPTPKPTKTPAPTAAPTTKPTVKPTEKPKETESPKKTKAPEKTKKPEETKKPIHFKTLLLPEGIYMVNGTTEKIVVYFTPDNATDTISYKCNNTKIATVKNGVIYAKKAGTTTITATTSNGIKKTISLTVGDE